MSEEIKVMIEDAVRKLETLPPMQQSLCVGFVLGAGATENTKKDERELTFRFERAEGETELFAKVAGLGKGRGQLRELGRILCFTDN